MNGITAYHDTSVQSQTPGALVVMLYSGAIKFLKQALQALEAKDYIAKGKHINRAVAIIEELNVTLNMEIGGELPRNLRGLYLFMVRHLNQANLKKDPNMIREVIGLLDELNQGWRAIAE